MYSIRGILRDCKQFSSFFSQVGKQLIQEEGTEEDYSVYIARGMYPVELGDIDVIAHEGRLHLFYLNITGHDVVSHIVSDDGMHWKQLPNALRTGEPGDADDDQIWTMHAFAWKGRFYMLYTCLAQADDGRLQKTGLAVSDDLIRWTKVPHNPVAAPDPRWYEADLSSSGRADWRDPFAWIEGDTIHGLVCAHEKDGPFNRRGCVAHITSKDALHWTVEPPFYTPRISTDLEVPSVFTLNGRYYLLGHIVNPPMDVYRIAEQFAGPWHRPMDDTLLPHPNHDFHVCEWRGKTMIFNWLEVGKWDDEGDPIRMLPPPKVVNANPDGTLCLIPHDAGWDTAATEPWRAVSAKEILSKGDTYRGDWQTSKGNLICESHPGMGLQLLDGTWADFDFEATIASSNAPEFGVVFRSDDTADQCMRVSCIQGRQTVELHRFYERLNFNSIGRGFECLQTRHVAFEVGKAIHVRISAYGPYIEVSIDGSVCLAMFNMYKRDGRVGFFLEDGSAMFKDIRIRGLEAPAMKLPKGPIPPKA